MGIEWSACSEIGAVEAAADRATWAGYDSMTSVWKAVGSNLDYIEAWPQRRATVNAVHDTIRNQPPPL